MQRLFFMVLFMAGFVPCGDAAGRQGYIGAPVAVVTNRGDVMARPSTTVSNAVQYVFRENGVKVTATCLDGVTQQVAYEGLGTTMRAIQPVLSANAGESEWHEWTAPGTKGAADGERRWRRADDAVMAHGSGQTLVLTAAEWNAAVSRKPSVAAAVPTHAPPDIRTPHAPAASGPPQTDHGASADKAQERVADQPGEKAMVRVSARPTPRRLPVKGTPRADVIREAGTPPGTMQMGAREVLVYRWGEVTLIDGKVHHARWTSNAASGVKP